MRRLKDLLQKKTKKIDLQLKTVIPGFNDAHEHLGWNASNGNTYGYRPINFSGPDKEAVIDSLAKIVKRTPKGRWIYGSIGLSVFEDASFTTNPFDTLIISSIGYRTVQFVVKEIDKGIIITMSEIANYLDTVTVYDRIKLAGVNRLPKESNWVNKANEPGSGMVPVFGPGYVVKGPISYFMKSSKEKRRLKLLKEKNANAKIYTAVVNAVDVKDVLKKKYSLTDDQYYEILTRFNQSNEKDAYLLDRNSLMYSIFSFFQKDLAEK